MRSWFLIPAWLMIFLVVGVVTAQQATPAIPGVVTPIPATATPGPDDPRLSLCSAPNLDGFVPYIVRPGDRLADLLTGAPHISVTQLAALNCLDDSAALPVGAVVWIPGAESPIIPAADADTAPAITRFTISHPLIQNQGEVNFQWRATGEQAYLYACPGESEEACPRPFNAAPVSLIGSRTIGGFTYAGRHRYRLEVTGAGETVTQDVLVRVTCSQQWLGDVVTGMRACPQEPALSVFAAWQPFEGGVMLWFSDTREIWVLTNADNRVTVFPDTFLEGEPDPAVTAPADRFAPVRGFGRVWVAMDAENGPLGWAYALETGFDSARQAAGSRSYTTYIQGPGETIYAVTLIPQIGVGLWAQIAG